MEEIFSAEYAYPFNEGFDFGFNLGFDAGISFIVHNILDMAKEGKTLEEILLALKEEPLKEETV